jgi:hypothetical protein
MKIVKSLGRVALQRVKAKAFVHIHRAHELTEGLNRNNHTYEMHII